MSKSASILSIEPLRFPWQTDDPFLFCVHHDDAYPAGNDAMGPAASLAGRRIGMDFEGKDGWRMYHGDVVPGFPRHPHRGFETVTVARRGFIDHSDSLGATARFGEGDVQWMTAGRGIVHAEMFPLRERQDSNPAELFQIWLNLPKHSKMVEPHFSMLWSDGIPQCTFVDGDGATVVTVVAGSLAGEAAPAPPPDSWAADASNDVAIWTIEVSAGARWSLPPGAAGSSRILYYFRGTGLRIDGTEIPGGVAIRVRADAALDLATGAEPAELLLLQGRPIGEPIAHHGPFVMNTGGEIRQAMMDYQRSQFGGWPWPSDGPVHPRDQGRFARHADGGLDTPDD